MTTKRVGPITRASLSLSSYHKSELGIGMEPETTEDVDAAPTVDDIAKRKWPVIFLPAPSFLRLLQQLFLLFLSLLMLEKHRLHGTFK